MSVTATAATAAQSRRPTKPAPGWRAWAGGAVVIAMTLWAALEGLGGIGFTLAPLFTDLTRGAQTIAEFARPNWAYLDRILPSLVETFYIAVIASLIGCGLALPVALSASSVTSVNGATYGVTRAILNVLRSLPDVAYGVLFVAAAGTGPLAGILALIFFNIGVVAKLTSETIDAVDLGPLEAADASGAGKVQRAWSAVVPQILPTYLSYSLYVFELNIRASVVLGYLGAGGIGSLIQVQLARFNYGNLGAIIAVLFVVVFALDQASRSLRRRLV